VMPIYDYKCRECGNIWEVEHSISVDDAVEELGLKCPECGSQDIFKYLGKRKSLTVKFIGTGWYINDSALEAAGMPEATRNSPETKKRLFRD